MQSSELSRQADARPQRRWLQFKLRTFLLLTAVAGIVAGIVGRPLPEYRREARAISAIRAAGGRVRSADFPMFGQSITRKVLGNEVYQRVIWVDLSGSTADDKLLVHVGQLRRLRDLNSSSRRSVDSGVVIKEKQGQGVMKLRRGKLNGVKLGR